MRLPEKLLEWQVGGWKLGLTLCPGIWMVGIWWDGEAWSKRKCYDTASVLFIATNTLERQRAILTFSEHRIAKALNANVVSQAAQYVYGDSPSHLRFVQNRLRR
jgi:hypothetical protein